MPYSKDLTAYPVEFWGLFRQIAARPPNDPFRLQFPTRGAAIHWRQHFHAWRIAVKLKGGDASMMSLGEYNKLCVMEIQLRPTYSTKEEKAHRGEPAELIFRTEPEWAYVVREALRAAGVTPQETIVPKQDEEDADKAEDFFARYAQGGKKPGEEK